MKLYLVYNYLNNFQVLNDGYLMISIDFYNSTPKDWFCYHCSSASIMPAGFCDTHGINLKPPQNYSEPFKWKEYLEQSGSVAAPKHLFDLVKLFIMNLYTCKHLTLLLF